MLEEGSYGVAVQALWEQGERQEWADALLAALPVQGVWSELHRHARTRQAAGDEGHCGFALCQRLVDEPHRQIAGRLDTHDPGVARAVCGRLRAQA